jgi:hypothetical protein
MSNAPVLVMPKAATVSEQRVAECIPSARFWANHLNSYSEQMQSRADIYAIIASLISTITGLTAWQMIATSPKLWAQVLVAVMAFAAAVVAFIPKVKGYNDCAVKSAPLSTEYGKVYGDLLDALSELQSGNPNAQFHAQAAVDAFQRAKEKKDALRPFPRKLEQESIRNS